MIVCRTKPQGGRFGGCEFSRGAVRCEASGLAAWCVREFQPLVGVFLLRLISSVRTPPAVSYSLLFLP